MKNFLLVLRPARTWFALLSISLGLLSACGGGSDPAPVDLVVQPQPQPQPVNVDGPGHFQEALPLKSFSAADVQAALAATASTGLRATPKYAVKTYRLNYLTVDGVGQPTLASALVAVPQKPLNAVSPVLSYQHGTISKETQAPSNLVDPGGPEIVMASLGYLVLSADYVGYGASKGVSHPYMLAEPTAAVVVNMLTAAKYWRQVQGVADNQQLFMAGYSEGGYATMAAHRALQAGSSPLRLEIVAVVPGAGPYDVALTLDEALASLRKSNPLAAALLQPGLLKYLSEADRNNVRDYLLKSAFGGDSDVRFYAPVLDFYLADDRAAIEARSNVYDWAPLVPVFLFHGRDDATVAYANATKTLGVMQSRGAGSRVTLTDCVAQPAGHSQCVQPYWRFMLDTFAALAKDL